MSKDNTELDVNGQKYTPASVTGIPLAPLALKEHALNVGLDKIRSDNGINGFNKDFLELAGTDLAEKKAKKLALLEEKRLKKEALEAEKLAKKEALLAKNI